MPKASLAHLAVVIAGHGSRDHEGVQEFLAFADLFRRHQAQRTVEVGFLEFAQPTVEEAVDRCVAQGAQQIVVLPGVLMSARHAKDDLAAEVQLVRRKYPQALVHLGHPLHLHPKLLQLCRQRIEEAEAVSPMKVDRQNTCLVVVGRGSSDPDANGDMCKLARIVWEGMQFGWSHIAYSGITTPRVRDTLDRTVRMGFRRVLVFPCFLFTGRLVKEVYALCAEIQASYPNVDILPAGYLGTDALLLDVFLDRAQEAVNGSAHMNCSLCQYRVPIIGFEDKVGTPQMAHHTHVRGGRTEPPHEIVCSLST